MIKHKAGGWTSSSTKCPKDYTHEGAVTWFGYNEGCMCPGASNWVDVDNRRCENKRLKGNACYTVAPEKKRELEVINGSLICVKRDSSLTLFDFKMPIGHKKGEKGKKVVWECEKGLKSCTNDTSSVRWCLPEMHSCPIVNLRFKKGNDGEIIPV